MTASTALYIVEGAVGLIVLIRTLRLIGTGVRSMMVVFFLFAMITFLVNNTYWIAYDLMLPDVRMPFSADELGEAAFMLLFASALGNAIPPNGVPFKKQAVAAILFSAASVALWIGWSGEWVQDIVGGAAYCYFLCVILRCAKQIGAYSRREWIVMGAACTATIALQAAWFHIPSSVRVFTETAAYILMFVMLVWIMVKAIAALRTRNDPKVCLALSFTAYMWVTTVVYMTAGVWDLFATVATCAALLLMSSAVRAAVRAEVSAE